MSTYQMISDDMRERQMKALLKLSPMVDYFGRWISTGEYNFRALVVQVPGFPMPYHVHLLVPDEGRDDFYDRWASFAKVFHGHGGPYAVALQEHANPVFKFFVDIDYLPRDVEAGRRREQNFGPSDFALLCRAFGESHEGLTTLHILSRVEDHQWRHHIHGDVVVNANVMREVATHLSEGYNIEIDTQVYNGRPHLNAAMGARVSFGKAYARKQDLAAESYVWYERWSRVDAISEFQLEFQCSNLFESVEAVEVLKATAISAPLGTTLRSDVMEVEISDSDPYASLKGFVRDNSLEWSVPLALAPDNFMVALWDKEYESCEGAQAYLDRVIEGMRRPQPRDPLDPAEFAFVSEEMGKYYNKYWFLVQGSKAQPDLYYKAPSTIASSAEWNSIYNRCPGTKGCVSRLLKCHHTGIRNGKKTEMFKTDFALNWVTGQIERPIYTGVGTYSSRPHPSVANLYTGPTVFPWQAFEFVQASPDLSYRAIEGFKDFLQKIICGDPNETEANNKWHYSVILHYLINEVQHPHNQFGWMIVLHSVVHGAGKGQFVKFMQKFYGPGNYMICVDIARAVKWDDSIISALGFIIDEFDPSAYSASELQAAIAALKNLITEPVAAAHAKYAMPDVKSVFASFLKTTNHPYPLDPEDRRTMPVSVNPVKMGDTAYWAGFEDLFFVKEGWKAVYLWICLLKPNPQFTAKGTKPRFTRMRRLGFENSMTNEEKWLYHQWKAPGFASLCLRDQNLDYWEQIKYHEVVRETLAKLVDSRRLTNGNHDSVSLLLAQSFVGRTEWNALSVYMKEECFRQWPTHYNATDPEMQAFISPEEVIGANPRLLGQFITSIFPDLNCPVPGAVWVTDRQSGKVVTTFPHWIRLPSRFQLEVYFSKKLRTPDENGPIHMPGQMKWHQVLSQ